MSRKTKDIIIIFVVIVFVVAFFVFMHIYGDTAVLDMLPKKVTTEKEVYREVNNTTGDYFELYTYEENGYTFANVYAYMEEQNDLKWDKIQAVGDVNIIYTKYDTDHYVISVEPNSDYPDTQSSIVLMLLEVEHEHEMEEYTKTFPGVMITYNPNSEDKYTATWVNVEDHFTVDSTESSTDSSEE